MSRSVVLQTYSGLLRAINFAFRGDAKTLDSARAQARHLFRQQTTSIDSAVLEKSIEHAKSVTRILYENVVQGARDESSTDEPYKLNIHERTERGDNATIKKLGGTGRSFDTFKT